MRRDYPPGVVLHAPHCREAGDGNRATLPVLRAITGYPSHRWCPCGNVDDTPHVVVEQIEYGPHLYTPMSSPPPRDATRALCGICRGTHGNPAPGLLIRHA
ncbi:hypothetical protein Aca07nite_59730 [Actinoplanes capillaceus]|uniref:Uncharacterized protein n=1 Tax=Actinoplanes campanulatus TaxID=113559 RepID=A0ABQ3WR65_9ACTN|nr:hypothetical protein [Actinoplanes capillaceus]GID48698.1 hypothetical protein Aca07nite_59730 [Actinoplanes capillaceus]